MSTARTTTSACSPLNAATPAAIAASGPPPGGDSRVKATAREAGVSGPTTTTSAASSTASRARSSSVRPAWTSPALSAPPRRAAVPPVRITPAQVTLTMIGHDRAWWQAGAMQVVLVQEASSLDPEVNRERLASLVPEGADLVVLPEAFARDFGDPGSDVAPYAEPLDGPFATEVEQIAEARGTTVVAGMFERSEASATPPYNTLVVRGGAHADFRKIHLYDSFGYRESDVVT